jgi:hypothetical protein
VWEREICSVRELKIIPINAVVSEFIWGQQSGLGNGIKERLRDIQQRILSVRERNEKCNRAGYPS